MEKRSGKNCQNIFKEEKLTPVIKYEESEGSSSDGDYSDREYYNKKNSPTVWKLAKYVPANNKRSIDEFENVEYYRAIKKPSIESEEVEYSDISENEQKILIKEFDIEEIPFEYEDCRPGVAYQILSSSGSKLIFYEESCEDELELDESSSTSQAEIEEKPNIKIPETQVVDLSPNSSDDEDNLECEIVYEGKPESSSPEILNEFKIIPTTFENQNRISVKRDLFDSPKRRENIGIKKWRESSFANRSRRDLGETSLSGVVGNNPTEPDSPETTSYHDARRVTRSCVRSIECSSLSGSGRLQIGKFVWGYCMGWWPAIIVDAKDVGIEPVEEKVCVYWIGEDLVSLLNEKTQVEPFSSNLDTRLLRYLDDKEVSKDRRKTSFITLKLFSKHLETPLIKPYGAWAEKHLVGKSYLNDVVFYPFPKLMQQRMDQLKLKNNKLTESNARAKEKANRASKSSNNSSSSRDVDPQEDFDRGLKENGRRSNKFPKEFVRKSTNDLIVNSESDFILPLMDQKPGAIVWGKIIGHSWWPAMIIHYHDCGTKEPNYGCQWILWYGDYRLSQVHHQNVMKFDKGIRKMRNFITQCKREIYTNAVLNACKDYCARLEYETSNWTMDDVLTWVSSLGNNFQNFPAPRPNDGRLESKYSSHIAKKLNEIKANQEVAAERERRIKSCDALTAVFAGLTSTLKKLCIGCLKICQDNIQDHPFFECVLCNDCIEEFKAAIFAYGDDGKCFFCTMCSGSDTIVMCDSFDCPRVYCTACLKYLICPTEYDEILMKDPWWCFLCVDAEGTNKDRLFKPRSDWKTRIGQMYHTKLDRSWNNVWKSDRQKKKIRVLSLFDGISTGLLALEKLGIIVEKYYASEIDVDAKLVSTAYFGKKIIHLGDVRDITKETIARIGPIDLLIGGSPCNDLSLANPNRLGLDDPNGTGVLFFDYCRIKELVTEANKGHHLFWLFENVASMPSRYRLAINASLRQEPSLIDAADFSPQHRPRLFWSNLPIGINFPLPDSSQDLQSVLTPNCDRHALVKKIQTVTTKVNSLKQGVSLLKPVLMEGKPDCLWITELEEIFGLPKHFTDVKNLSATKRQKLIGQSWSVQTIIAILRPVCYFFVTENEPSVSRVTAP